MAHVEEMYAVITREHQEAGRRLKAATLDRIRATLRAALNAALRQGLIEDNPTSLVALPPTRRPRAVKAVMAEARLKIAAWITGFCNVRRWHSANEGLPTTVFEGLMGDKGKATKPAAARPRWA